MNLDFVRIECDIAADIPVQLTAALSDSLCCFEAQFKAACCRTAHELCSACGECVGCPYRSVFAQQLSADPEIVRLHQKPSLPFTLYVRPAENSCVTSTLGMVVIGSAIYHIEKFHTALLRMIENCIRSLLPPDNVTVRIYSLDYSGLRHEIFHAAPLSESVILLSARHVLQNTMHSEQVRLIFLSPLRLVSNGSIAHGFDFAMFFRSQLRRCSSLCAYYGTEALDLDFAHLSRAAQNVAVLEDGMLYTHPPRSAGTNNRAGLTGTVECTGLIEPMYSLLLLGSYFNAGKGAALGSGYHHVEVL